MIRTTFTILTARPNTPNTATTTAPDLLLALQALAQMLGCAIHWDGTTRLSPNPHVPSELFCKLEDGFAHYDARLSYTATDATVESVVKQLYAQALDDARKNRAQAMGETPAPAPVTPPVPFTDPSGTTGGPQTVPITGTAEPGPTPDPVIVEDPEDGKPRLAAAWG